LSDLNLATTQGLGPPFLQTQGQRTVGLFVLSVRESRQEIDHHRYRYCLRLGLCESWRRPLTLSWRTTRQGRSPDTALRRRPAGNHFARHHVNGPAGQPGAQAWAADAAAGFNLEKSAMPRAGDEVAIWREIIVERLRQGQLHVRTMIEIAESRVAPSHDERVEAAGLHLNDEGACVAVFNHGNAPEPHPLRSGGQTAPACH
jgi:hypothetical protein